MKYQIPLHIQNFIYEITKLQIHTLRREMANPLHGIFSVIFEITEITNPLGSIYPVISAYFYNPLVLVVGP